MCNLLLMVIVLNESLLHQNGQNVGCRLAVPLLLAAMSDFSLTLVLQFKTSKIINDMAKVQIKSERITPFGGIFHVRELFSRYVGPVIDKKL